MLMVPYPCCVSLSYLYRGKGQLLKSDGEKSTAAQVLNLVMVTATNPVVLKISFKG